MTATPANAYDEVLYPSFMHAQTHPDRLATLATLFGMAPAPVERCRALELACGDGTNLVSIAFSLPGSQFVGMDTAARALAKGQRTVELLGLKNIQLRVMDLREIGREFGEFDYIIAHGLYSWVPAEVREKIMAICRANLAPHGVAYVSYNTLPGSYLRQMMREMMQFHIPENAPPEERVRQARALVQFLADAGAGSENNQHLLRWQQGRITSLQDALFFHDDLSEVNEPFYFHQFIEHAARHGLQYLAEADFFEMQERFYLPAAAERLRLLADQPIIKEQYMDFLSGRAFRQTLLCHQDVALNRAVNPARLTTFFIASCASPAVPNLDVCSPEVAEFNGPKGPALKTNYPLTKAALLELGEAWPQSLRFDELLLRARRRVDARASADDAQHSNDARLLSEALLEIYAAGLAELHLCPPRCTVRVSERPVASPLARVQAQQNDVVTNLRHTSVQIEDSLTRHLVLLLDGTRDTAALVRELAARVTSGAAQLPPGADFAGDRAKLEKFLADGLARNLTRVARLALLIA